MYRFALRPRWLAFHLLVVVLVVVMVNLAFWQLRRLDARRALNDRVEERSALPAVPIDDLITVNADPAAVAASEWRPVTATGRYDPDREVLIRNRSFDGAPGFHVVTPLVTEAGTLLVNRGWIPLGDAEHPVVPPPPSDEVTVTGRVRAPQERGRFGARDPAEGTLDQLARVDVPRIAAQTPGTLYPLYVERIDPSAAPGELPAPLPLPELDEGPHLSYAGQWFLFSAVAVVAWAVMVRRAARQGGRVRKDRPPAPADEDLPVA